MNNIIKINGNMKKSQIQQGSSNSIQTIKISNEFDYDKVLEVLMSIQKTSNSDEFTTDFGNNAEKMKTIITEAIDMVNKKDEPSKIKNTLEKIKDIAQGVTENAVATWICHGITSLPIWQ